MASEHLLHLYQQIEGRVPNLAREEDLETSTSGGYLATIYISYKNTFGQSTRTLRILNSAVFRQTHPHTVYIYIWILRKDTANFLSSKNFQGVSFNQQKTHIFTIIYHSLLDHDDRCSISNLRSQSVIHSVGSPCLPALPALVKNTDANEGQCLSVFRFVWFLRRDILLFVIVIGPRTNPSIFGLPSLRTPPFCGKQRKQECHAFCYKNIETLFLVYEGKIIDKHGCIQILQSMATPH